MAIEKLTAANFAAEVEQSSCPVVVDFWATWCGPCRMLSPLVDEVAEATPGVKTMKCDVDEEGALAAKFGIDSIPCLIRFENGKETARNVGFVPKAMLVNFFNGR